MSNLLEQASLVLIPSGYKEDVVYSQIPLDGSGDMSFTRSSNGTRVNSAGLVEVCPWNLLEQSEQLNASPWVLDTGGGTGSITITNNYGTAPNGTTTADRIQMVRGTVYAQTFQPLNVISGAQYTLSVYLKSLSGTPTISTIVGADVSSKKTLTTEWIKYELTFNSTSATIYPLIALYVGDSATADILAWGYQVNIGSTAKPYFPTTDRLNVPRLTYQNGGGGCPSLLLEKQSTNIILQNNEIATAPWQNFGGSHSNNSIISPDGTQNASTMSNSPGGAGVYQSCGVDAVATYTATMYAKLGTATNICLVINNSIAWNTVGGISFTTSNGLIANQWARVQFTFTAPINGNINIHIGGHSQTGVDPQSAGSFFIWGVQIEKSSYPTSVIPSTTSSATRVADACFKTGISSLIGVNGGSIFVELDANGLNSVVANYIFDLSDGSNFDQNRIAMYWTGVNDLSIFYAYGGTFSSVTYTFNFLTTKKVAVRWTSTQIQAVIGGVAQTAVTYGNSSPTKLDIGSRFNATELLSCAIKECVLFNTTQTTADLIALTT